MPFILIMKRDFLNFPVWNNLNGYQMKKILIVEDEPAHLKTMIDFLSAGPCLYEIISAGNGKVACAIAEAELPDLIIMDWELPLMNGIDAIRYLKTNESTRTIPVIMCTGVMMTSEDLQTAFDAGAIDYIRKPVDKTELTARTRSILMLAEYFTAKQKAEVTIHDLTHEIQVLEIARLTTDLEFSNRELTAKAMFLLQKNELLSRTIDTLEKIMSGKEEDFTGKITALIKSLKMNRTEKSWKEFETHFNQVHADFYTRLQAKYPMLTSNEKKLCAYIRLNLSTKEICAITQRSQKSTEMARTRLRQKLNLLRDEPLSAVIAAI